VNRFVVAIAAFGLGLVLSGCANNAARARTAADRTIAECRAARDAGEDDGYARCRFKLLGQLHDLDVARDEDEARRRTWLAVGATVQELNGAWQASHDTGVVGSGLRLVGDGLQKGPSARRP